MDGTRRTQTLSDQVSEARADGSPAGHVSVLGDSPVDDQFRALPASRILHHVSYGV